jgi:hypothetical protein
MPSTYSPDLRIELIGTGDQAGVWGITTNNNLAYVIEQAVAGYISVSVISANQALTYISGGSSTAADNQSVHAALALTTTTGANFAVYAPPSSKQYTIYNASAYVATIYNSTVIGNTTAAGTGVAIPAGKTMTVWSDGTNFDQQNTHLISPTVAGGTFTSPNLVSVTMTGGTFTSPTFVTPILGTPTSGTLTNATGLPISTGVSGLGTNVATFLGTPTSANLAAAVTGETGTGALVFATSPALTTPDLGTPSAAVLTNATSIPLNQGTGNLAIARFNSGTGATSSTYWRGDGTWAPVSSSGGTITSVNGQTGPTVTLTAANVGAPSVDGSGAYGTWGISISGSAGSAAALNSGTAYFVGSLYSYGNVTAYYTSDIKFKENVRPIPDALATVNSIGGKLFDWTNAYIEAQDEVDGYFVQKEDFGFVAQDIQKVFPLAVRTRKDGSLAVDYVKMAALAFAAIGELTARIEALEVK